MSRMLWQLLATLILTALVLHYAGWILLAAAMYFGYRYGLPAARKAWTEHEAKAAAHRQAIQAVAARADSQHNQVMTGDEHGLWGVAYPAMKNYQKLNEPAMPR